MNQSTNYNFNLPEGTDLVNLLTQLIPNWSNLDTLLKGVEDQAFTNCTEVVALGVHAITRSNADGKILKWIASANYTAGDTFTIDGNLVSAATASGEALATNAIVSGAVIIAALNADESAMTIFVTGTNVASDSAKLGGELPSYYATASDMSDAQSDITDLDNLMGSTSISAIGDGTVTGAIAEIADGFNVNIAAGTTFANAIQAIKNNPSYDATKFTSNSTITISGTVYRKVTDNEFCALIFYGAAQLLIISLVLDSNTANQCTINAGGSAFADISTTQLAAQTIKVKY